MARRSFLFSSVALVAVLGAAGWATPSSADPGLKVTVRPVSGGRWPSLGEARHRAEKAGKPLLLEFSTSWCGPCREFARHFVRARPVAFRLAQVVYVSYDAEKGAGLDAAARFGISEYPTFLLFDDHGHLVWSHLGSASTPAQFADRLDRGLARALSAKAVEALVAQGGSPEAELLAAAWAQQHGKLTEARRDLEAAEAADPGGRAGVAARARHRLRQLKAGSRSRPPLGPRRWHRAFETGFEVALTQRLEAAGRACARKARRARKVAVRVDMAPPHLIPAKVTVLSKHTPRALARCLEARIARGPLPFVPGLHHPGTILPYTRVVVFSR